MRLGARNSLLKNLVTSVVWLGKRDTLHARRQAAAFLETPASVKKLFDTIGPKFSQRHGGYTRITRLAFREGDGAELCKLELVGMELRRKPETEGAVR